MGIRSHLTNLQHAVVASGFLIAGCGDGGPTKPEPPLGPRDYVVYFQTAGSNFNLRFYHTETGVIDSIPLQIPLTGNIAVSPDGSHLYVTAGSQTKVLETQTLTTVATLPYGSQVTQGGVVVSPDNRWMAIFGTGVVILDPRDYSVLFTDTGRVIHGTASPDGRYFLAGAGPASSNQAYRLDLSSTPYTTTRRAFPGAVWRIVSSRDNQKWYVYTSVAGSYGLYVYDVALDSIIYRFGIGPGYGDIRLSGDGVMLFSCSPGSPNGDLPNPSAFYAYNTVTNELIDTIWTVPVVTQNGDTQLVQGNQCFAMTPDGRKLISGGGMPSFGSPVFIEFDIQTWKIDRCIELGRYAGIRNVACQSGL